MTYNNNKNSFFGMKKHTYVLFGILFIAVIFFIYKFAFMSSQKEHYFYPMGGMPCRIVEYDVGNAKFAENTALIEAEVDRLENIFNSYRPDSEVSRLKNAKKGTWYPVSQEMYRVLRESLGWSKKTGGAFDVTVAPIIRLWKSAAKEGRLPTLKEKEDVLKRTGYTKIELLPDKGVKFSADNVELDFGGIAKGYILDQMAKIIENGGNDKYIVSCGGDVVMKGKESFKVGIQEPGGKQDELMMVLSAPPGGVVTSGHYERYLEINGKRYSHIIDPKTAEPVNQDLVSITVLGANGTDADALATGIAVMGLEKAEEFLESNDKYSAVIVGNSSEEFQANYSKNLESKLQYIDKWQSIKKIPFE